MLPTPVFVVISPLLLYPGGSLHFVHRSEEAVAYSGTLFYPALSVRVLNVVLFLRWVMACGLNQEKVPNRLHRVGCYCGRGGFQLVHHVVQSDAFVAGACSDFIAAYMPVCDHNADALGWWLCQECLFPRYSSFLGKVPLRFCKCECAVKCFL